MLEKLAGLKEKFELLTQQISDAAIIGTEEWKKKVVEHSALQPIMDVYAQYLKRNQDIVDAKEMLKQEQDADMRDMLEDEIYSGKDELAKLEEELKILLLPKDPNDDKNVIIEIRAGAGGDEAGLFGAELKRMYTMYADLKRWRVEEIDGSYTEIGGVKEVTFMIAGAGAYSRLKYESGVHRVQRVPETESQGRVHTSTITVAVLPEVENVEIEINEKDLKIDTYRSSGAGGQHVNKTESAIRITHLPTGMVVTSQDERSQIKNREKAMRVLKSRLYDYYQTQADQEYAANRRMQIGTGDRSERIRTYNFPQGRVTDHRIGLTLYSLTQFMNGNLDEMIDALALADQNAKLASQE